MGKVKEILRERLTFWRCYELPEKDTHQKVFMISFQEHRFAVKRKNCTLVHFNLSYKCLEIFRWITSRFYRKMYGKMKTLQSNCGFFSEAISSPSNLSSNFFYLLSLVFDSWILQKSNLRNLSGLSVQMEWAKEFAASSAKRNKLIWKLSPRRCPIMWKNNIKEKFSRMRLSQCRRTLKVKKNLCPFSCFIATFANISH